jgi:hypothetical protein
VEVIGEFSFDHDFLWPKVNFLRNSRITHDDGIKVIEHTSLDCDWTRVYFADEIENIAPLYGGQHFLVKSEFMLQTLNVIAQWKKNQAANLGADVRDARLKTEIEKMKEQVVAGEGGVTGQIRVLKINPSTGEYTYHFVLRNKQEFEIHAQNHEDPSCDELSMLLALAI